MLHEQLSWWGLVLVGHVETEQPHRLGAAHRLGTARRLGATSPLGVVPKWAHKELLNTRFQPDQDWDKALKAQLNIVSLFENNYLEEFFLHASNFER